MASAARSKKKNASKRPSVRKPASAKHLASPLELNTHVAETRSRAQALLETGDVAEASRILAALVDTMTSAMDAMALDNTRLTLRVDSLTRLLFGRRSERLSREDLKQLALAFGASEEAASVEEPFVPVPETPIEESEPEPRRTSHKGRTKLAAHLEREVTEVAVPEGERACGVCGVTMSPFGHVEHERVEIIPAKIIVRVERREKLGCKSCRGDAVTAERSAPAAWTRRAGASLLAHLIEAKCDDALPIHRQRDQLARLGFEVPANTLYAYWEHATSLLGPVASVVHSTILGDEVIGLDDTRLDVLDRSAPQGRRRGHLWCTVGTGTDVAFAFTPSWEADEIQPWIEATEAYIQCDDYKGYDKRVERMDKSMGPLVPHEKRLGCGMHIRRRFHAAMLARDLRAKRALEHFADLYAIEAEAKGLAPPERLALRTERSLPLLDELDAWVDALRPSVTPTSPLGKALGYAAGQRTYFRRCFTDGRFEIDNGRVEREIRRIALGRKNFLFSGSDKAAARLADAYTLVQSAKRAGIPVRDYLVDILEKLEGGFSLRRVAELTPTRWAAERGIALAHQPLE
jgi:transposase